LFTKSAVVSSGLRVMKTSIAQAESGVLDVLYGQEGVPSDEVTALAKNIGKS